MIAQQEKNLYIPEINPLIIEKLEKWQDLKFGLLMHWGTYSQWGIVESWSICAEDEDWCRRKNPDYEEYKKQYENLQTTFNPEKFNPEKWAKAARNAGMKYVVFTTKHHDGFCMFDTKYTDYKITSLLCPFHTNPKANITKEIFDAFRKEKMWVGAYFSKPDWHSDYYWWKNFATPDRNVNYEIKKYPERWNNFVEYTHNQILELSKDFGKLDILWLDGGWVRPMADEKIRELVNEPEYKYLHFQSQDIKLDELVSEVRMYQPDLLVVDRDVPGINQNYLTPENTVPEKALPYPWESCIIAGSSWSWVPDAKYITIQKLIQLLVDIVSKGGNLLLNIAPGPDGEWDNEAYKLLDEMGKWMKINSEAIYGTRTIEPYKSANVCFTQNDKSIFAFYIASENKIPEKVLIPSINVLNYKNVEMLGTTEKLITEPAGNGFTIQIPKTIQNNLPCNYCWVFKINK